MAIRVSACRRLSPKGVSLLLIFVVYYKILAYDWILSEESMGLLAKEKERPSGETIVRLAEENDLRRVNELRKQVNDLHVAGKPDVFKPGFSRELQDYIYEIWKDPEQEIVVAERNGTICGYAVVHHILRPESHQ